MPYRLSILISCMICLASLSSAEAKVEKWGIYEIALQGPNDGNPFLDVQLRATFRQGERAFTPEGFYDGVGVYKVRFMPDATGAWTYVTKSNTLALDGKSGSFECVTPSAGNHGPVRVADTFRFAYADGTPHFSVGTTCYVWTHQPEALQEQTLATLKTAPFNKLRMCVFPIDYLYNRNEPPTYPFPRNAEGVNDFSRFTPKHFQCFENRVAQLQDMGIEADIILLHPYDRWGYQDLDRETADRYLRYCIARLGAYRNVWWSMANEYDALENYSQADWDRFFRLVQQADPYNRLRSIHNAGAFYDHSKPWVTHLSVQGSDLSKAREYRDRYRKPVVFDECLYEGNVPEGWGNISASRMTDNFWAGTIAGCFVGHSETYEHPEDILWWTKGGVLHGQSSKRIAFMKDFIESIPYWEMEPDFEICPGNPVLAKANELYLLFFAQSNVATITLPGDRPYKIDGIDTWNMTVTPLGAVQPGAFTTAPFTTNYVLRFQSYAPGEKIRPVAKATQDVTEGTLPLEVQFEAEGDYACQWDFGDGETASGQNPKHTYTTPKQYTVHLTVTDREDLSAQTALKVVAIPETPKAALTQQQWPGLSEGLLFSWTNPDTLGEDVIAIREQARFELDGGMLFNGGAFLFQDMDARVYAACRDLDPSRNY